MAESQLIIREHALIKKLMYCYYKLVEVIIMKKIIVALLVLSVALIGISFVAASSGVNSLHSHSDDGTLCVSASNDYNPLNITKDPFNPWGPHRPLNPGPTNPFNPNNQMQ